MRFKSTPSKGFQAFAVSGTNTVSFAITASSAARKGLLGFAVERIDPEEDERYFMPGLKVFPSVIPQPGEDTVVSTWDHPVQSLVWDDFTAKPDRAYEYLFYPLRGRPKNLDRSADPVRIRIRTEPLYGGAHDVFFNRGAASSQAYRRQFGNRSPDSMEPAERQDAIQWLTRDLDEAVLRFISETPSGDRLFGCFYEFRYAPVTEALRDALSRGVDVRLILDAKENGRVNRQTGTVSAAFPRTDNLKMLDRLGIAPQPPRVYLRQARAGDIQHNKFLVRVSASTGPVDVWTGSTNLSLGGFAGQTNVGHWVRDPSVAARFADYWTLLSGDPGGRRGDPIPTVRAADRELRERVAMLHEVPTRVADIPRGTTTVFSPRSGLEVLDLYADMLDSTGGCACITLAFGINERFKKRLVGNDPKSNVVFMLLERRDRPRKGGKEEFIRINAANNVYQAWGSRLRDPVLSWAAETDARELGLNRHVSYVHSKFLLSNPLSVDPIVVTGSANFSAPSTNENDENMLLIRGDQRVADLYFTEFNRLFNHYYFRSVREAVAATGAAPSEGSLMLSETSEEWLSKYAEGTLRTKRVQLFAQMAGAQPG